MRYRGYGVTVVTALPWLRRYRGYGVIEVTALPWLRRYRGYGVTVVTALPWFLFPKLGSRVAKTWHKYESILTST